MRGPVVRRRASRGGAGVTALELTLALLGVSLAAGFLGALVGTGGGIILVPAMTLLFGIDIRYAIGASIVSVIATSSGSAAAYVRERLTNLKVAMFLAMFEANAFSKRARVAMLTSLVDRKERASSCMPA